jgi:hypothetical protein
MLFVMWTSVDTKTGSTNERRLEDRFVMVQSDPSRGRNSEIRRQTITGQGEGTSRPPTKSGRDYIILISIGMLGLETTNHVLDWTTSVGQR